MAIPPEQNQAFGPAKVIVVLQIDSSKEAAIRFHKNERFLAYSCEWRGLICFEPRPDITNYSRRHEAPPDWNMEEVWDRLGVAEEADRERIRGYYKMGPGQPWGQFTNIPPDTCFYDLDDF